jgi:hypothetical protein
MKEYNFSNSARSLLNSNVISKKKILKFQAGFFLARRCEPRKQNKLGDRPFERGSSRFYGDDADEAIFTRMDGRDSG